MPPNGTTSGWFNIDPALWIYIQHARRYPTSRMQKESEPGFRELLDDLYVLASVGVTYYSRECTRV